MLTRRKLLAAIPALGAATAAYALAVEPRWLERVIQPVAIPGMRGRVRVLHLSDFHASFEVPLSVIQSAVTMGLEAKPDVICLTGDFVTREETLDWDEYACILKRLSDAAPTFATLGNHDGGFWSLERGGYIDTSVVQRLIARAGLTPLYNSSQRVRVRGTELNFTGVGDYWSRGVDGEAAFAAVHPGVPNILMAHNPDTKEMLGGYRWDLMLSGHTHGGQVLVPLVGDSYAPVQDKRYIAGLKPWRDRQIYVTRGVGSLHGVRFRCRPEVTILDIS